MSLHLETDSLFLQMELDVTAQAAAVGKIVEADGYDIKVLTGDSTATFYGEIIEVVKRTGGTFYKIIVRKNG